MSIPTISEQYTKLMEHLRLAQESAAMIAHLYNAESSGSGTVLSRAWLHVSEGLKRMQHVVTEMATRKLN